MGLPYSDDELRELIEEEDACFLPDVIVLDGPAPIRSFHVIFKGNKYTIVGSGFIRSIEPFNQELCDLLFQARDKIQTEGTYDQIPGFGIFEMIRQAANMVNVNENVRSISDLILCYDPDFADEDEEDDAVDE